jgi:hypothetical protein
MITMNEDTEVSWNGFIQQKGVGHIMKSLHSMVTVTARVAVLVIHSFSPKGIENLSLEKGKCDSCRVIAS